MPRRRKKTAPAGPRLLLLLFGVATLIFVGGELWRYLRSDNGTLMLERTFGWGDRARLTEIVTRHVRRGLVTAGVARDSIREEAATDGTARLRWRVGLTPEASLIQTNAAIADAVTRAGGRIFAARERNVAGGTQVTVFAGVGRQRTHQIVLERGVRPEEKSEAHPARVALVLYGFGDDQALATETMALARPFAVAIPPDTKMSRALFAAAHRDQREVVLHVPLEPVNYPQVDPGPGTLLVTMKPTKIASELRRQLGQGKPAVAIANLMGSLATQDMTAMTAIYGELRRERLPFIHITPAPGAVCRPLASQLGIAYDEPDVVLDAEARAKTIAALDKRWKAIVLGIPPGGQRMVWLRLTPTAKTWLEKSLDPKKLKDVDLVPLTALLRRPPAL